MSTPDSKPQPPFKIRAGRRGDAEPVRQMLIELGYTPDAQTVTWIVSHPEMELFIASDVLDKPIGVVSLSHRPQLRLGGRIGTIDELVVTQAWRRKGVGRELLKRAVERAKVLGVKRLEVQTMKNRYDEGAAFLSACGFGPWDGRLFNLT